MNDCCRADDGRKDPVAFYADCDTRNSNTRHLDYAARDDFRRRRRPPRRHWDWYNPDRGRQCHYPVDVDADDVRPHCRKSTTVESLPETRPRVPASMAFQFDSEMPTTKGRNYYWSYADVDADDDRHLAIPIPPPTNLRV